VNKPRVAILDIDGTLLLSNDAHARAFCDAATSLGVHADFNKVRRLIGKGGDKILPEAFGLRQDSALGKQLEERKGELFKTFLPLLEPAPGARDLLSRLRDDGIKLVIATSASQDDVQPLLERAGVSDLIDATTSSDDAESSKPEPDIVKAAVERAGERPEFAIMLGDTPYDIEAALRSGVAILAVRCGGWQDADLHGALAVFNDPADILKNYEQTPFGCASCR
jgi:HAD superfamily hydrolase (TIGR01549 family)